MDRWLRRKGIPLINTTVTLLANVSTQVGDTAYENEQIVFSIGINIF